MAEIQIKKGSTIFQKDSPVSSISIILDGRVEMNLADHTIVLETGDVLGLIDLSTMVHSYDQIAVTDLVVDSYPIKHTDELFTLIQKDPEFANQLTMSMLHLCRHILTMLDDQIGACDRLYAGLMQISTGYLKHCADFGLTPKSLPGFRQLSPLLLSSRPADYSNNFYVELSEICFDLNFRKIFDHSSFIYGIILQGCKDIRSYLTLYQEAVSYEADLSSYLLQENHLDYIDLYSSLRVKCNKPNLDYASLHNTIADLFAMAVSMPCIDENLCEVRLDEYDALLRELAIELENDPEVIEAEQNKIKSLLTNSFVQIMSYAYYSDAEQDNCQSMISQYKKALLEQLSEEDMSKIRAKLTPVFEKLYRQVFFTSMKLHDDFASLPVAVKLFLRYGFVDEEICGIENAIALYKDLGKSEDTNEKILYFYDYLKLIYEGEMEPSRNMMDQSYPAYLDSLLNQGEITKEQMESMLLSGHERVLFELSGLFANGLKVTYGRSKSYCPILCDQDMLKNPENSLLSQEAVQNLLQDLLAVDFSAFYREVLYYDKEKGIHQELIINECLPEIILLPNVGTRGVLWQEISGADRNTPARMLLPVQCLSDSKLVLLRLVGEFRWEMCKRIQGTRWNDISAQSLTSEYFDYLQFYKKNSDLSEDAKEKCKLQLQRTKNRYRENFLLDYASWIMYETKGLPKLNKVSRKILMRYCPPAKELREKLAENPLYTSLVNQYEAKRQKEESRIDRLVHKMRKNYGERIPAHLKQQGDYIRK